MALYIPSLFIYLFITPFSSQRRRHSHAVHWPRAGLPRGRARGHQRGGARPQPPRFPRGPPAWRGPLAAHPQPGAQRVPEGPTVVGRTPRRPPRRFGNRLERALESSCEVPFLKLTNFQNTKNCCQLLRQGRDLR